MRPKVIVAAHVSEVYGPVQALASHLERKGVPHELLLHPLGGTSLRRATRRRADGSTRTYPSLASPAPLAYAWHLALTLLLLLRPRRGPRPLYVGIDALNAFAGVWLRRLRVVDRVVFYVIDYTPRRFENRLLNRLYLWLDRWCARRADAVWNISGKIAALRREQGVAPERNLVVGVGVELHKVRPARQDEVEPRALVVMSHLTRSKGVELVIDVAAAMARDVPGLRLDVIGTGPHEAALREHAARAGAGDAVRFLGPRGHDDLMAMLPRYGVGIATYLDEPGSITWYADPTKPKEYLACGLPVVITRVPWIADEIERRGMGAAIGYDAAQLRKALEALLADEDAYWATRERARAYGATLSWDRIYDEAFAATGGLP